MLRKMQTQVVALKEDDPPGYNSDGNEGSNQTEKEINETFGPMAGRGRDRLKSAEDGNLTADWGNYENDPQSIYRGQENEEHYHD